MSSCYRFASRLLALACVIAATSGMWATAADAITIRITAVSGSAEYFDGDEWIRIQVDDVFGECTYIRIFEGASIEYTRTDQTCGNRATLSNESDNELNAAYYHVGENTVLGGVLDVLTGVVVGGGYSTASAATIRNGPNCQGVGNCGVHAASPFFARAFPHPDFEGPYMELYSCVQEDPHYRMVTATFWVMPASDPGAVALVEFDGGPEILNHGYWIKISEAGELLELNIGEPPACVGTEITTPAEPASWGSVKSKYR